MPEEVRASFLGAEIWGLQRRTPCLIVLTDQRLIIVKGSAEKALPKVAPDSSVEALLERPHYSLTYETIRYVDNRIQLTWSLFKIYTTGGGYRFRLKKRTAAALQERLREVLGARFKTRDT